MIKKWITKLFLLLMLFIGSAGFYAYNNKGILSRSINNNLAAQFFELQSLNEELNLHGRKVKNFQYDCNFYQFSDFAKSIESVNLSTGVPYYCYSRSTSKGKNVFLWGDSHAQMLYYGLYKNLEKPYVLSQVTKAACRPNTIKNGDSACDTTNDFAISEIAASNPEIVIIAQRDAWKSSDVIIIQQVLEKMGIKEIWFVGKSPEWTDNLPKIILRKHWIHTPKRSFAHLDRRVDALDDQAKLFISNLDNVRFISLRDYLCNEDGCLVYTGENVGQGITSFDGHHLSPSASDWVAKKYLVPLIKNSLIPTK
jgi:hypothetical protein